jgi:hypothetical protein
MTDSMQRPGAEDILGRSLGELKHARNVLSKAASRLRPDFPVGSPLTRTQSQARTMALTAIDEAQLAIDRATDALHDALRTDEPPTP